MPTKSQSPGPNPTTSSSKAGRSRKAANQSTEQNIAGRAGSAGGIVLEKEQKAKTMSAAAPTTAGKAVTTPPAKDKDATAAATGTGPARQRRRPRKLNEEPASAPTTPATATTAGATGTSDQAPATEIEALKSRVRGLEAKVEELYRSSETRTGRSPRRRGKGRKGSSAQQVPTLLTTAEAQGARVDDDEEADEELVRLEDELETARRDLELYKPRNRPRGKRTGSDDDVEEIPRDGIGIDDTISTGDRQVTLSGSYRIPFPSSVSIEDVKTIQSGVSAAQNVAKSFLEQRRARNPTPPTPAAAAPKAAAPKAKAPQPKRAASTSTSIEVSKQEEGKSWSQWIGGYSMAISRAAKTIQAEAAIESQRPNQARTASTPSTAKRGGAGTAGKRPKARGGMSSEQVHGLMS